MTHYEISLKTGSMVEANGMIRRLNQYTRPDDPFFGIISEVGREYGDLTKVRIITGDIIPASLLTFRAGLMASPHVASLVFKSLSENNPD